MPSSRRHANKRTDRVAPLDLLTGGVFRLSLFCYGVPLGHLPKNSYTAYFLLCWRQTAEQTALIGWSGSMSDHTKLEVKAAIRKVIEACLADGRTQKEAEQLVADILKEELARRQRTEIQD